MSDHPTDFELKLKHIITIMTDVITEWHEVGLQLDLPEHILKLIGSNPDVEDCLRMMLSKWLDYDTQASWDKLTYAGIAPPPLSQTISVCRESWFYNCACSVKPTSVGGAGLQGTPHTCPARYSQE